MGNSPDRYQKIGISNENRAINDRPSSDFVSRDTHRGSHTAKLINLTCTDSSPSVSPRRNRAYGENRPRDNDFRILGHRAFNPYMRGEGLENCDNEFSSRGGITYRGVTGNYSPDHNGSGSIYKPLRRDHANWDRTYPIRSTKDNTFQDGGNCAYPLAEYRGAVPKRTEVRPSAYDGKSEWKDYIVQFELIADLNRWDPLTKGMQLASALRGNALSVLGDLDSSMRRNYESLVGALSKRFGSQNKTELFRARLKSRQRQKDEGLPELAQSVRRLVKLAYPKANYALQETLAKDHLLTRCLIPRCAGEFTVSPNMFRQCSKNSY
ncbi:hypothetical protein HOLleu_24224 [Holothuria leucospilota]|uniref:Uncharacterized protein n=1 Tax=Holothuria leucospilota TaxID=206669 RepID=A0A9Q1H661_HOLLE|nr:hypothetical protein HOLleu_24224 [Holothuria leucospilota]